MVLLNNFSFNSNFVTKLPQQKIAQVISVCLLVYITSIAAKITWLVIPDANQTISNNSVSNIKSVQNKPNDKNVDLSKVQALNLFGKFNEVVVEKVKIVKNAPETRLKLTLSGLVASDDVNIAAAIIENKGKQATYGIGDIIEGTRASLEQVFIDRILISQSGRTETLMLDGFDFKEPAVSVTEKKASEPNSSSKKPSIKTSASSKIVDQRTNRQLSINASNLRKDLNSNPGKITDYLRIRPKRTSGRLVGYSLQPGKNPDFFKLSGLKSGDVAVQMNGHNLLESVEAIQAMSALKTERDISLLVQRKDELIEILFSID